MFCFKELDKKLQNLGMKQLMACTDLQTTSKVRSSELPFKCTRQFYTDVQFQTEIHLEKHSIISFYGINNAELTKPNNLLQTDSSLHIYCLTANALSALGITQESELFLLSSKVLQTLLPHPAVPGELGCDQSAAGSTVALTLSNPPTSTPP